MQVAVIGAGAAGLTAALRLAQAGAAVTVFEREKVLGGLTASFSLGGTQLERYYHHIFRSDRTIISLIEELGLGQQLRWLRPKTSILFRGKIHQLDSPDTVLRFGALPVLDRLRLAAALAYLKLLPDPGSLAGITAAGWAERWMGRRAYELVWKPLLEQKFGAHYAEIGMPWFWARVHCRSTSLGYLRYGFGQLYDRLGDKLVELGGTISLGATVQSIRTSGDGRPELVVDGRELVYDRVIATVPTRVFTRLAEGLPEDYRRQYDWGDAYGAHCVILGLDRSLSEVYWLMVNDPGFPFLVAVEHTNLMPREDYGGRHVLYLGNYLPMDHPRFRQSEREILGDYLPALRRINPTFDPSWVQEYHIFGAPYAQPIVTLDYPEHIPPLATPLPGVFLANMFQVYPQDRGQNYSILLGERVAGAALTSPPNPLSTRWRGGLGVR